MNITEEYGLPFVSLTIVYKGKKLELQKVLLDTGSASTLFNADLVRDIGVVPEENDVVDTIRGVGGIEYVYTKYLDAIEFDGITIEQVSSRDWQHGLRDRNRGNYWLRFHESCRSYN